MKKLNKLEINPQKIMKTEELITLRGGYDVPPNCQLYCNSGPSTCTDYEGPCTKCVAHPTQPGTMICVE